MSVRELRGLKREQIKTRLRSGRTRGTEFEMSGSDQESEPTVEGWASQLESLRVKLREKDEELERLSSVTEKAKQELEESQKAAGERITYLEQELAQAEMRSELNTLRALEKLRSEHRQALDKDTERMEQWMRDLKESHDREKAQLLERIAHLESTRGTGVVDPVPRRTGDDHVPTPTVSDSTSPTVESEPTVADVATTLSATAPAFVPSSTTLSGTVSAASDVIPTPIVTTPIPFPPPLVPVSTGVTLPSTRDPGSIDPSTVVGVSTGSESTEAPATKSSMMEVMTQLMKAQADAMTAQAKATAVQHLPSLPHFTGEGEDVVGDSFDKWVELFRERATFAGWGPEDQLYHLKVHLDKTAMEVYRALPDSSKTTVDGAISALRQRFKPGGIEELQGLEFHRRIQGEETIEQLGLSIQHLGRRAYPSMSGKDFDRLLKGRFYQALKVIWQRKLGPPKAGESFHDLLSRARMLEEYERQYQESAKTRDWSHERSRNKTSGSGRKFPPKAKPEDSGAQKSAGDQKTNPSASSQRCYRCKEVGHLRKDCPLLKEAPGRSKSSSTASIATRVRPEDITESQLEHLLAQKRLEREGSLLPERSETNTITAAEKAAGTVGPLLEVTVEIEGVPTLAMVDTGAQSTILSRSAFHEVVRHLQRTDQRVPSLELPTVKLYGKDGQKGGKELYITAQTSVVITLRSRSVTVPVFIQPDSEQPCLLGMNALLPLGIQVVHHDGKPLLDVKPSQQEGQVSKVNLVSAVTVLSQKGRLVQAEVLSSRVDFNESEVLFEPNHEALEPLGLECVESLVTVCDGKLLLPIENPQGIPIRLDKSLELGTIRSINLPSDNDVELSQMTESCQVAHVKAITTTPERATRLFEVLDLPVSQLSSTEADKLKALVTEFSDVFALDDTELGCTDLVEHSINTGDHSPVRQQPYRTPIVRRAALDQLVTTMREQGIIEPSSSPWASPVVLVPKKDGSLRFCVDYRRLNSLTRKDVYPLPRVDDILISLGEAKYFSSLDLASGYWQIKLDEDAREKSAFTTHNGLFEFVRMPFGLCNAPATFQRVMQRVLSGVEPQRCFAYLDDVLVASKTFEDHLHHLREVFLRLRSAKLRLKPKKCRLLREKVNFLGHIISADGIEPDPSKVEQIKHYPVPTDVSALRRFLGLASYYRRFVPKFASVAAPLHRLTKKKIPYEWTEECGSAFDKLKTALTTAPVLAYPRFGPNCSFILDTDASTVGLGAVLSQEQEDGTIHPVAYASRSVNKHESNYGISELETLGLVWAVRYFRPYLLGHPCTVFTDHTACLSILNTPRPSGKLARWALTIQEMDLTIKHKKGRNHTNADALSRSPMVEASLTEEESSAIGAVESLDSAYQPSLPDVTEVRRLQAEDSNFACMLAYLQHGELPDEEKCARKIVLESKHFSVVDGVLYRDDKDRHCTAVPTTLRLQLMEEAHRGRFAGHLADKKVHDRLRRYVWWPGMRGDVYKFCRSCLECASRKTGRKCLKPPLHPIPIGGPFHRVAVDILQLPLTASGNKYVAVFMDYFTKWPEAFAIPDQKAETIAKLFIDHIVCRHGIPEELLSDRGANFLSTLIQEICKILGVSKINTSGYHPQTDGLVEKFNSTLTNMIAKSCNVHNRDWDEHLPCLLFAYRCCAQESTKESPFFLMHGRDPRIPTESVLTQDRSPYAVDTADFKLDLMSSLSLAWRLAGESIKSSQISQKKFYDRLVKKPTLQPGDRVMVFMPSEQQGKTWKLSRPFHGPYRVLKVTDTNAEVRPVDRPEEDSIFVHLNRVRMCFPEQGNEVWKGHSRKKRRSRADPSSDIVSSASPVNYSGPVTRSRAKKQND